MLLLFIPNAFLLSNRLFAPRNSALYDRLCSHPYSSSFKALMMS